MKTWNVFKMELYKNIHSRTNLIIMAVFMVLNIIGGLVISNFSWFRVPTLVDSTIIMLFSFSMLGTAIFLFIYPLQMARADYKNKVMSLLIASGVSRVKYYFVKVGATLLFSLLSIILLVVLPLIIVLVANDMRFVIEMFDFFVEIDITILGILLLGWLSIFTILMTSVIVVKGRMVSIFVFLGFSIAVSQVALLFQSMFAAMLGLRWWELSGWWGAGGTFLLFQHLITIVIMGMIGILVLRKQNL